MPLHHRHALSLSAVLFLTAAAHAQIAPLRQPAEFEPMRGAMVAWPLHVPLQLCAELAEDDELVTLVHDATERAAASAAYLAAGIDLANCTFLVHPNESHWTRDYGPWFAFASGQPRIQDFHYEWPASPGDNGTPALYAAHLGLPLDFMPISTAGGNYMTDGLGSGYMLKSVLINNPGSSQAAVRAEFETHLGLTRTVFLPDPGDYYLHVDCAAKLLAPDVVMVSRVHPSHVKYADLEDLAAGFAGQLSAYGTPYEVHRVDSGPGDAYANALILNDKVYVPLSGSAQDAGALAAYQAAMPGYEVLGFLPAGPVWPDLWVSHDALHCRTKELVDEGMLYLQHVPRLDGPGDAQGFEVRADVAAYSGASLDPGMPELVWRVNGGAWSAAAMTSTGGTGYAAHVPPATLGDLVEYYLHATDGSGRDETHPLVGAAAAHAFTVTDLGADASAVSIAAGCDVHFELGAGAAHGGHAYLLLASLSGTSPGTPLPGGLVLPLNADAATDLLLTAPTAPGFSGFLGTFDAIGHASADWTMASLPAFLVGLDLDLAWLCLAPMDAVASPLRIELLE